MEFTKVTEAEVAAARMAAAEAAQSAAMVEQAAPSAAGDHQTMVAIEGAYRQAALTAATARTLAARLAAQNEAAEARAAAETAAEDSLDGMGAAMAQSRDKAVQAIRDAEKALTVMLEAVAGHEQRVRACSAALANHGLQVRDAAGDHQTGATAKGGLVLRGEWWLPADPGAALAESVYGVAVEKLGYIHPISARLRYGLGREGLQQRGGLTP